MNKYITVFVGLYLYPLIKDISHVVSEDITKILIGHGKVT